MKSCVWFIAALLFAAASNVCAGNVSGEYESRTSQDKVNVWYRTERFEVFVLKNTNLQLEFGPRFSFGNLSVTTKLGGVWNPSDTTVQSSGSVNLFFRHGRLCVLSVNSFSLERIAFSAAYQEGYVMIGARELVSGLSLGINFEHYQIAGEQQWIIGPRMQIETGLNFVKTVSVWAGITDNPTAGVFFTF